MARIDTASHNNQSVCRGHHSVVLHIPGGTSRAHRWLGSQELQLPRSPKAPTLRLLQASIDSDGMRPQGPTYGKHIAGVLVIVLTLTGCLSQRSVRPTKQLTPPSYLKGTDPKTTVALLHIATVFNDEYAKNDVRQVYERWDAESQRIISEVAYVKRHLECPSSPGAAQIEDATPGSDGFWIVHYSISGQQFSDFWHYEHGHWLFNLRRSNPQAVQLYRESFSGYARAVGCTPSA